MSLEIFKNKVEELKAIEFGTKVEFTSDSFPKIPQILTNKSISITNNNRFVSSGLKDFLVADISKDDSIALGLWILGCYFQKTAYQYKIKTLCATLNDFTQQ